MLKKESPQNVLRGLLFQLMDHIFPSVQRLDAGAKDTVADVDAQGAVDPSQMWS